MSTVWVWWTCFKPGCWLLSFLFFLFLFFSLFFFFVGNTWTFRICRSIDLTLRTSVLRVVSLDLWREKSMKTFCGFIWHVWGSRSLHMHSVRRRHRCQGNTKMASTLWLPPCRSRRSTPISLASHTHADNSSCKDCCKKVGGSFLNCLEDARESGAVTQRNSGALKAMRD